MIPNNKWKPRKFKVRSWQCQKECRLVPHSLFTKNVQVPAVAKVTVALLIAYVLSAVNMIACNTWLCTSINRLPHYQSNQTPDLRSAWLDTRCVESGDNVGKAGIWLGNAGCRFIDGQSKLLRLDLSFLHFYLEGDTVNSWDEGPCWGSHNRTKVINSRQWYTLFQNPPPQASHFEGPRDSEPGPF